MPGAELLRFKIAWALPLGKGMALLGWTCSAEASIESCTLFFEDDSSSTLKCSNPDLQVLYTPAPPPENGGTPGGSGFILWLPTRVLQPGKRNRSMPMFTLNDQVAELERPPITTPKQLLDQEPVLTAFGPTLLALAQQRCDSRLQSALQPRLQQLRDERSRQLGRVEQVWQLQDVGMLLLSGRLACQAAQVVRCVISGGKQHVDVTQHLHTSALVTAYDSKGQPQRADAFAFALLLDLQILPMSKPLELQLVTANLAVLSLPLQPLSGAVQNLVEILSQAPAVALPLLSILHSMIAPKRKVPVQAKHVTNTHSMEKALQQAADAHFTKEWQQAQNTASYSNLCLVTPTMVCAMDEAGLLVLGTFVRPAFVNFTLWLHAEGHAPLDVSQQLQFLPVHRNLERLRKHFPQASEQLFFILHVPRGTHSGARHMLRLQLQGVPDLWLKVQTSQRQLRGIDQVKALLAEIPHSEYLWRQFKTICDAGLGCALHWLGSPAVTRSTPVAEEFGLPAHKPTVSIIVPLYGRWDFMRHQLAQFCKDPDFSNVDLIYVVDDPSIHAAVLNDASHYQPLFNVPFRVVTYAENRGFAGANNSAVPFARAPMLLLLNSDVLPQEQGWLTVLRRTYMRLPQSGMVSPLLQFPEGSVQHAGMAATRQANNPGLVFSHHPGKGGAWEGGRRTSEHPLLTGACLLLSKQDYEATGGLDEDYLVGDFEDSDFSLRIRALGKRLYLVPAARLWHLERQSQYLGNNDTAVRDMLTLYNAWRYHAKIAAGLLPDPELT